MVASGWAVIKLSGSGSLRVGILPTSSLANTSKHSRWQGPDVKGRARGGAPKNMDKLVPPTVPGGRSSIQDWPKAQMHHTHKFAHVSTDNTVI